MIIIVFLIVRLLNIVVFLEVLEVFLGGAGTTWLQPAAAGQPVPGPGLGRSGEMAVRQALGAEPLQAFTLVLRHHLRVLAVAVGLGLLMAVALARLVEGMLFGVSGADPLTYLFAGLAVCSTGAVAIVAPALRAFRADPTALVLRTGTEGRP